MINKLSQPCIQRRKNKSIENGTESMIEAVHIIPYNTAGDIRASWEQKSIYLVVVY